jgi:predicted XRE-type DNA-binding protein
MSRRDELAAVLKLKGLHEREITTLIEATRAEQLTDAANLLEVTNPDRSAEFSEGVDWALGALRTMAKALDGGAR